MLKVVQESKEKVQNADENDPDVEEKVQNDDEKKTTDAKEKDPEDNKNM